MRKIIFGTALLLASAGTALGASVFDITFPIPELGNCASQLECKTYCQDPANQPACQAWAEANGFTPKKQDKPKTTPPPTGPGGCQGQDACKAYCADATHQTECINFAVSHGFMSASDGDRALKFRSALASGGPGGCTTPDACKAYCENAEHRDECVKFAKDHGLTSPETQEKISATGRIMKQIQSGNGPGGCKTPEACRVYCQDAAHKDECIKFLASAGGITQEQAQKMLDELSFAMGHLKDNPPGPRTASSTLPLPGPGGCATLEACKAYCELQRDECEKFFKEHRPSVSPRPSTSCIPAPACVFKEPRCLLPEPAGGWCKPPTVSGSPRPSTSCKPAPPCVYKEPRCLLPEPAGGWCKPSTTGSLGGSTGGNGQGMPPKPPMLQTFPGPGGCANADECKAFCLVNYDVCKEYYLTHRPSPQPTTGATGPSLGGTVQFCKEHPDACKNIQSPPPPSGGSAGGFNPPTLNNSETDLGGPGNLHDTFGAYLQRVFFGLKL